MKIYLPLTALIKLSYIILIEFVEPRFAVVVED